MATKNARFCAFAVGFLGKETFCATTGAQIKDFLLLLNLVHDFPYVVTQFLEKLASKEVPWQKQFIVDI